MTESAEKRRARHERAKAKAAADPEYAAKRRAQDKAAKKRYEAKKRFQKAQEGPVGKGKPGRIVALCGWMHW